MLKWHQFPWWSKNLWKNAVSFLLSEAGQCFTGGLQTEKKKKSSSCLTNSLQRHSGGRTVFLCHYSTLVLCCAALLISKTYQNKMTNKYINLNVSLSVCSASVKGWNVSAMAALLPMGSAVLNGEDVHVEGQTRGACICLAVAQKCLAFHTTPLGALAWAQPEVYEKQRVRGKWGNQEGEKCTGRGARREEWAGWHETTEREIAERRRLDSWNEKGNRFRWWCDVFHSACGAWVCVRARVQGFSWGPRGSRGPLVGSMSGFRWGTGVTTCQNTFLRMW